MILKISWNRFFALFLLICCLSSHPVKAQFKARLKARGHRAGACLFIRGEIADDNTPRQLAGWGYDVFILDAENPASALHSYEILHTRKIAKTERLVVAGKGRGARLAAQLLSNLSPAMQPDDLILLSPAPFNETIPGTVIPLLTPPFDPTARLLTLLPQDADSVTKRSCSEFTKTWRGYDGEALFRLGDNPEKCTNVLDSFLHITPPTETASNPAAIATPGWGAQRHTEKLALEQKEKFDLLMIGNSITHNFEKAEYLPIWDQFFAPRKALDLGYSGYRTENILWNIEHGELDGQSPKVVILEIGTNNVDEAHYPTRHTSGQLAGGVAAIAKLIRQKLPDTKLILLRPFPGCYGGPNPTSHRAILERTGDRIAHLADGQHIFYCDINHVFLNFDGTIRHELMPDWLHPNAEGARRWAEAMEPLLSQLMGDSSRTTNTPSNTAIIPVTRLEEDSYNWWDRHHEVLRIKDSVDPEIVLIGNSITHFWGGLPALKNVDGTPRKPNGQRVWDSLFAGRAVLNLGFGWDRTQNALWRLDHGEMDGLHPRTVIIDIGTNNTSQTEHARMNTAAEIAEGVETVCARVRSKVPNARIILMAIFPREQSPDNARRRLIDETNRILRSFARDQQLTFVDIGPQFLNADGTMRTGVTSDFCHPTEAGYSIWANALRPLLGDLVPRK